MHIKAISYLRPINYNVHSIWLHANLPRKVDSVHVIQQGDTVETQMHVSHTKHGYCAKTGMCTVILILACESDMWMLKG